PCSPRSARTVLALPAVEVDPVLALQIANAPTILGPHEAGVRARDLSRRIVEPDRTHLRCPQDGSISHFRDRIDDVGSPYTELDHSIVDGPLPCSGSVSVRMLSAMGAASLIALRVVMLGHLSGPLP